MFDVLWNAVVQLFTFLISYVKALVMTPEGILVLIGVLVAVMIYVIKKTKTTVDDEYLAKFGHFVFPVVEAVEKVIPDDVPIPALQFADKCLDVFIDTYKKENGIEPPEDVAAFARRQYEKIAPYRPKVKN